MKVTAIIPAAGIGKRFAASEKKQFFRIYNEPLFYYTLKALANSYPFEKFIIGASVEDFEFIGELCRRVGIENFSIVEGGAERYDTVFNCLKVVETDYVLIHDAVRPFFTKEIVENTVAEAVKNGCAICAVPVKDTLKKISGGMVTETVNRDEYVLSHTPQVFDVQKLFNAFEVMKEKGVMITDEAQAMEIAGFDVAVCSSTPDNVKVTYIEDVSIVKGLVNKYFK